MSNPLVTTRVVRPAYSAVNEDDAAGYLWIVTILGAIYTFLMALARVRIKFRVLGSDDYLLGLATVVHLVESVIIFASLFHGLAKSNELTTVTESSQNGERILVAEVLAVTSLCLSKCSVAALLIRIVTVSFEKRKLACWTLMMAQIGWGLGSIVGLLVQCDGGKLLIPGNHSCPRQILRWQLITVMDVATEVVSSTLPLVLVWDLNMSRRMRTQVIFAFSFRLPMAAISIPHLQRYARYPSSASPQLAIADSLCLLQAMLTWSLISATVPNLRGFIKSFATRFGMSPNRSLMAVNDYPLTTIGGSSMARPRDDSTRHPYARCTSLQRSSGRGNQLPLRPDIGGYSNTAQAQAGDGSLAEQEEHATSRNDSRDTIIVKEVRWDVQYDRLSDLE